MTPRSSNSHSRSSEEIADKGATMLIEHVHGEDAIVQLKYPAERRKRDRLILGGVGLALALMPVLAWCIFRHTPTMPLAVAGCIDGGTRNFRIDRATFALDAFIRNSR